MNRICSNGPQKDFVINPFNQLAQDSSRLYLAAPYFTLAKPVLEAARKGKTVQLIVGLNPSTSPSALEALLKAPNLAVRYFTSRFHAKIYIFDNAALVGSSNLTDGGFYSNREAVFCLDQEDDREAIEELRALFSELWETARVLTNEKLADFITARASLKPSKFDAEKKMEDMIGRAEPYNISVASRKPTTERLFVEGLRQRVYEQYRPAFTEVTNILRGHGLHRPEFKEVIAENAANRFLSWVRLAHAYGDEVWRAAPILTPEDRHSKIIRLGREWTELEEIKLFEYYFDWLKVLNEVFGSEKSIFAASREDLTNALMSIHAFEEQRRFVEGGADKLREKFWSDNRNDVDRIKATLTHLIHGKDEFIQRLHDILYDPNWKLARFGLFSALELYGTVKPEDCPPMNGRTAKALRFLGFDVQGT